MLNPVPFFLQFAVPLEIPSDPPKFIGTGFLVSYPGFEGKYTPNILVTCKHVVKDCPNVQYRWNVNNKIARFVIGSEANGLRCDWGFHPDNNIDLAITLVPSPGGDDDKLLHSYGSEYIADVLKTDLGNDIFYFGFPLGTGANIDSPHQAIVRKGIISNISETSNFIIEANVFPGTSGSPVFIFRESIVELIGVISSYIPYRDTAISIQSGRPRIIFEENSGLATVFKSKYIFEIIESDEFKLQTEPILERVKEEIERRRVK